MNVLSEYLNINTCWSNIKISSYFNFWKLDYFSDMNFLKKYLMLEKPFMFKTFTFLLKSHIFYWKHLGPIQPEKFHVFSMSVLCKNEKACVLRE